MKKVLTIAGSDSGGGAGIQADLKAFAARGVYGMSAITALTAQNTVGVFGVFPVTPEFVAQQIDAVMEDLGADAWKTGMLANAAIIQVVAERARRYRIERLVVDPVMVAKSGDPLLEPEARRALVEHLLPLAYIVTPNRHEAQVLADMEIHTLEDAIKAAQRIHALGPRYVLVKGGHLPGTVEAVDILYDGERFEEFRAPRIETINTHGTGCTLASAIAAELAKGADAAQAVAEAKHYLTAALHSGASLRLGRGHGPVDHFLGQTVAVI
ncbi:MULTISPECIES: bifunctional hydroxymethylpyrimidine kinase/phosphomethylpyrimidine kinase [Caldilinea]|uniref:Phosphomethylpyrimidine kinase n=1 Tax=Caldilinea aerophila (strain DSM 14535 / JCM 11387 / NBRC 104270 / STL-6-O1) TaxID=926550 RepID=I0I4Z9_CALAS|nr:MULTISPECIES: bifunctional hydroxymethylpyrimidine kinase/phosphomethylpyrimidine kinase [Caldilinea]BAM00337.1 phosphomethylpyrimidine kinase [Caldilinea aerophila DSM 14535 = NBRC 104270]GIV71692.1 MAG: hydroxymethylpyrimidine/phosphomethylpyrimidine kinase [Caldilinea sp.]